MVKIVMIKKTKEQKIRTSLRRTKAQNPNSHTKDGDLLTVSEQFKHDVKKSAIIIALIIALEIILYFGTII